MKTYQELASQQHGAIDYAIASSDYLNRPVRSFAQALADRIMNSSIEPCLLNWCQKYLTEKEQH